MSSYLRLHWIDPTRRRDTYSIVAHVNKAAADPGEADHQARSRLQTYCPARTCESGYLYFGSMFSKTGGAAVGLFVLVTVGDATGSAYREARGGALAGFVPALPVRGCRSAAAPLLQRAAPSVRVATRSAR